MHLVVFLRRHSRDTLFQAIIGSTVLLGGAFLILFRLYGVGQVIGETPWYIPMTHALTAFVSAAVAFLAICRARLLADRAAYRIGAGFAAFAVLSVFYILSWPGLLPGGGGVITKLPGTSGWFVVLELAALGVPLLRAALRDPGDRRRNGDKPPSFLTLAVRLTATGFAALLVVRFEHALPALVDSAGNFSPLLLALDWLFLLLFALGAAFSTRAYLRRKDRLLGYAAFAQITMAFVLLTTLIGAKRYDLWYYISRIVLVAGFGAVFFGLLGQYIGLFLREREASDEAERGQQLLDLSSEAIFTWNLNGPVLSWNRGAEDLYGWKTDEARGRTTHELLQTGPPEAVEAFRSALLQTGTWTGELLHRTRDGRILTVEARLQLVEYGAGRRIVLEITRDVSDRRRAETALRESEQRLARAQEIAHLGSWELDLEGNTLTWSDEVYRIFGLPPQQFGATYEAFLERVHPDDRAAVDTAYSDSLREGRDSYEIEHRIVRARTDEIRYVHEKCEHYRDSDGRIIRSVGMVHDITERKQSEQALRAAKEEAEQRAQELDLAFSSSAEAILIADLSGRIIKSNKVTEELLGYNIEELKLPPEDRLALIKLQRPDGTLIRADDVPLIRATRGETVTDFELRFQRRPDGTLCYISGMAAPIRLSDGTIVGGISTFRDITEQKRMEEALKSAKALAEAANRAKTEFLARMSHELRTPLGGIIGMAHLLEGKLAGGDLGRYASLISESGKSLLSMIGDVLDLSQIESGKIELTEREFDLGALAADTVELFRLEAEQQGLELSLSVDEHLSGVYRGDADKIAQVLRNFIANAVKYTERGRVAVSVREGRRSGSTVEPLFCIADTGVGIAPEQQELIFGEFTRLIPEGSPAKPGTGLGLAIAKRLIHLLDGEICLESEPGHGSSFYFSVPLHAVPGTEEPAGQAPLAAGSLTRAPLRPLRVLLAEDTAVNRLFIEAVLREAGHTVTSVEHGAAALEALKEEPFDLVLMDIQMPVMDGIEATHRIRALERPWKDLPIIALTAYAMRGDRERMLYAGMDEYVTKPVDVPRLFEVIAHAVARTAA